MTLLSALEGSWEYVSGVMNFSIAVDERGIAMIAWLQQKSVHNSCSSLPFVPCSGYNLHYWQDSVVMCNDPSLLTTYVKICCNNCTGLKQDVYDCIPTLAPFRLQNFYSPNISFPLAIFMSHDSVPGNVFVKVHDYDGQMLKLFPVLCKLEGCNSSVRYRALDLFHDFDPLYGPSIHLVSSSTQGWSEVYAVQMSDYMWNNVERWELQSIPPNTSNGTVVTAAFSIFYQDSSPYMPYWRNWNSDIVCNIQDSAPCYADLIIYTEQQVDEILITAAPGFALAVGQDFWYNNTRKSFSSSDCFNEMIAPYLPCGSCNLQQISRLECRYYYTPRSEAVGENDNICFMARTHAGGYSFLSSPYCVRFHVSGPIPTFTYTASQENFTYRSGYQFDSEFYFFPACLGHNTQETVESSTSANNVKIHLYTEYPSNLTSNQTQVSQCGRFSPYGFSPVTPRVNPQYQLEDPTRDSSILAPLSSSFTYVSSPVSTALSYSLNITEGNGIFVDSVCAGSSYCPNIYLNEDIKIVAYSIDNSKSVYHRWVGKRPKLECYAFQASCLDQMSVSEHALGNYASLIQRWILNLQAPPYFQLNQQGCIISLRARGSRNSVSLPCPLASYAEDHRRDPYKDRAMQIEISATDSIVIELVARDPNPQDSVQIFALVQGVLPTGLRLSPTLCMPETVLSDSCPSQSQSCCSSCPPGRDYCTCGGFPSQTSFCPVDTRCNQAKLQVEYAPLAQNANTTVRLSFYPRDSSSYCALHGIRDASSMGWSGNYFNLTISVRRTTHVWKADWFDRFLLQDQIMSMYVGCVLSVRTAFVSRAIPSSGIVVERFSRRTWVEEEGAIEVVGYPSISTNSSLLDLQVVPRKGSEGSRMFLCVAALDVNGLLISNGTCSDNMEPCMYDSDCSRRCLPVCMRLETHKCRYCVEENILSSVRVQLGIDINWMRLWTLNDDSSLVLGTACPPFLDCRNGSLSQAVLDNPSLLPLLSQRGKFIVWVGLLQRLEGDAQAGALACAFRSSLASLQSLNPDLGILNSSSSVLKGSNVCLAACERSRGMSPVC